MGSHASHLLTLVVPTRNRWDFLSRLLDYYRDFGLQYRLIIGDSSDPSQYRSRDLALDNSGKRLNLEYRQYPDTTGTVCAAELLAHVSTPYAVWVADDDFVVPYGFDRTIDFLERHRDYSGAHGNALIFTLSSDGPFGRVMSIGRYSQRSVEQKTASERLVDHLETYCPTIFSVHRTELLQRSYRYVADLKLDNCFGELLPSSLPIVCGKIKKLDILYMARQAHAGMVSRTINPGVFDWITGPRWLEQWISFRDCLTKELAQQDAIKLEVAREVVEKAFWGYLAHGITRKWDARYWRDGQGVYARLREMARRVPGVRKAWHSLRSFLPGVDNKISLEAFLHSPSPYHEDFMPVYRAITTAHEK